MKKRLVVNTRWQYYVANVAGMVILLVVMSLCFYNSIYEGQVDFRSFLFWLAVVMLLSLPIAIISFFSSMKTIVVYDKMMVISYVFQRHENNVAFSDIVGFWCNKNKPETVVRPGLLTDSFEITLKDGRSFSFTNSQFDKFQQLKSIVFRARAK